MRLIQTASDEGDATVEWLRSGRHASRDPGNEQHLRDLIERFGGGEPAALRELVADGCGFDPEEIPLLVPGSWLPRARSRLSPAALALLEERIRGLRLFHLRTVPGAVAFHSHEERVALRFRPLDRVGVLLPRDGMAVSLLLSLAVPALVAGVREILVAMAADSEGRLPKGVLAACEVLGLRRVLRVGGTMGALALAFGTETTPAVDLLFGEDGDQARACMRALAGLRDVEPTDEAGDLVVISDGTESDPARLADELILHAELGGNGLRVVLCTDSEFMSRFTMQLREAYDRLPRRRRSVVRPALSKHGRAVLVRSLRRAVQIVNELAPDRLYLLVHTPQKLMSAVHRAGAVHVGELAAPSRVIWNWGSLGLPGLRYGWIPTAARFLQPVATLRGEPGGQTDVARLQRVWSELEPLPSLGATRSGARPEPEGRPAAEPTAS